MKNYLDHIKNLLDQNKTTGINHSEDMLNYTQLNVKRMERWLSHGEITEETKYQLMQIKSPQTWTVLTEAWCGDAAHSIGFIYKMAVLNPLITFEWKLRDENLDLMDQYLTNGGRSIPKLIVTDDQNKEVFNWGPRPKEIQTIYLDLKSKNTPYQEINIELQKLYNADKGKSIQTEISQLIAETIH
jgi:hypothetical protein